MQSLAIENKYKISIQKYLVTFILLYPLILFAPSVLGYDGFKLTNIYFLLFSVLNLLILISRKTLKFSFSNAILLVLFILAVFQLKSFRFSGPVFFIGSIFVLNFFLENLAVKKYSQTIVRFFYYITLLLSFLCLFFENCYSELGRFQGFVGSPTIYSAFIFLMFLLFFQPRGNSRGLFFYLNYLIVLFFIYKSETRLVLLFFILFPFIEMAVKSGRIKYKTILNIVSVILISLYPIYSWIVKKFPLIVKFRYEDGVDRSANLRLALYDMCVDFFVNGSWLNILFGHGTESARLMIWQKFGTDIMPHNDFLRILIDWGIVGTALFFIFLYKIIRKTELTFYIGMVYLLLFYSNTIYNVFLVSILLLVYHLRQNEA
jgi:hypothetical protein